jgi:curved DNA-binding protein CbpA
MKDFYKILEISSTSNIAEIKRAYRRLALKYHPDKNSGDTLFSKNFNDINEAYDILSNPLTKQDYDFKYKQTFEQQSSNSQKQAQSSSNNEAEQLIFNWIVEELKKNSTTTHVMLDKFALVRIKGFANSAYKTLGKETIAIINIPYITFIDGQAEHLNVQLTREILNNLIQKKKETKKDMVTPLTLLLRFQSIRKKVEGINSNEINQDILFNSIEVLLTENNIKFLLDCNDSKTNNRIIEEIIECCKPLPYTYVEGIALRLIRLANTDNNSIKKITSFIKKRKFWSKLDKFRGAAVIVALVIIIGTVYYLQTDHSYHRPKNDDLNNSIAENTSSPQLTTEQKIQYERDSLAKAGWRENDIINGQLSSCYNFKAKKGNIANYLEVNVGSGTDVVIKVINFKTEKSVRYVFINSGTTYTISNIPEGQYYLKIAYGKNWFMKEDNGRCLGKFIRNPMYEKGEDIMDFTRQFRNDGVSIPSFKLSLDVISTDISNSFNSQNISENDFNL